MLIPDKIHTLRQTLLVQQRKAYFNDKCSLRQEDTIIVSVYVHLTTAPDDMKRTLTDVKGEVLDSTTLFGDLQVPL